MSGLELKWIISAAVLSPLILTPFLLLSGSVIRIRKLAIGFYVLIVSAASAVLMYAYVYNNYHGIKLWWMKADSFSISLVVFTSLLSAAIFLWLGFKKNSSEVPPLIFSLIGAATGLASMTYLSVDILPYTVFWIGVSIAAFLGLIAARTGSLKKRIRIFIPWIIADLCLVLGAVLSSSWLHEEKVLIEAPLKSGSEVQVIIIMILFLAASFIRLGIFPFNIFVSTLFAGSDSGWSSFFLGAANFLLAGSRLIITACLIARFVATDWSFVITAVGLLSLSAGPLQAARARSVPSFLAGMYLFQVSFLVVGIGLFSRTGWEGAMYYLLVAPLLLTASIIAMDRINEMRGTNELGIRTVSPGNAAAAFIVLLFSGIAMAGLPPSGGFLGKAIVVVGGMDKSVIHGFNSLVFVLASVGCAFAVIAVIKVISRIFGAGKEGGGTPAIRPYIFENAVPIGLCGFAYLLGFFPGILQNNLIEKASRSLIPVGFSGPGVVFHGTGSQAAGVLKYYKTWAIDPAAFLVVIAAVVIILYFANRAAAPSDGPLLRFQPFEGGMSPDYASGRAVRDSAHKVLTERERGGQG